MVFVLAANSFSRSDRLKQLGDWVSIISQISKLLEINRWLEKVAEVTFFWIYTFNKGLHACKVYRTHSIARNASAGLMLSVWPAVLTHLCTGIVFISYNFSLTCWLRKSSLLQLHAGGFFRFHPLSSIVLRIRRKIFKMGAKVIILL